MIIDNQHKHTIKQTQMWGKKQLKTHTHTHTHTHTQTLNTNKQKSNTNTKTHNKTLSKALNTFVLLFACVNNSSKLLKNTKHGLKRPSKAKQPNKQTSKQTYICLLKSLNILID